MPSRGYWLEASQSARGGSGCVSMKRASQPEATPQRTKYGTKCGRPPDGSALGMP